MNNKPRLWTRDFTIITLGTVVSMFGSVLCGFALSLLVLDMTKSTMMYGLYVFLYTVPQIIMPGLSGPVLDRFSRRRAIYTLDFISAGIYALAAFLLYRGWFSYPLFAVGTFILGSIESVYQVAYDSFYPLLIEKENYQKAYSIASVLETVSVAMVPLAALTYNSIGIWPLLMIDAVSFLAAAVMETQIRQQEEYVEKQKQNRQESRNTAQWLIDLKEGMGYLKKEKGLFAIALYFMIAGLSTGSFQVLSLPYFRRTYANGEYVFMIVMGAELIGRAVGGGLHYRFQIPYKGRYRIALTVYLVTDMLFALFLYMPVPLAAVMMGICGILGVTSYTIRIASVQNYVPDEKKGRYNGAFNMLSTAGMVAGEGLATLLSGVISERTIIVLFSLAAMAAAVVLIGGRKKDITDIYEREPDSGKVRMAHISG